MSNLKKKRKKILEELRHAIRHQSKIRNQEMMEKLNTMIKNGNSTAKRWAQQRRSQLTVDKVRRVYNKLSYITGNEAIKPKLWSKFRKMGKPKLYRNQMLLLKPSNQTTKNTSHKPKADSLTQQAYKM
jgi:hypothetical protein